MKNLKISKEISLPPDVVTQTLAMIGRKGAGKTYLATMVAEQMLDIHAQVIVVDPVGNWWGLRVGADGKSKGKEIFVIGGDHGDIPIIPTAGAKIARLLVEKGVSAVLDVSGFRIGEHKKFAAEFAEEFFHLKKANRSPVHIFIEEAQKLIPQRVGPEEARMVGAFEQIVRLGRNYGIGCSLVTQRPQSVNKEVLSQVECLCVLQVTGPHERKALEEWVYESGQKEPRTLIGELPGLGRGEGYVWSPSWLRIYKKVHFSQKQTFDASATPEVGKKTKQASLSAVDVESIKKDMAEVVEQAEKDNPIVLRRKIVELERELSKDKYPLKTIVDGDALNKALEPHITAFRSVEQGYKNVIEQWEKYVDDIFQTTNSFTVQMRDLMKNPPKKEAGISYIIPKTMNVYKTDYKKIIEIDTVVGKDKPVMMIGEMENDKIQGGALRMLKVLVSRYPMKLSKVQLGTFSKLKSSSGTFATYLSILVSSAYIIKENDLYSATQAGIDYIGEAPNAPQNADEVIAMWKENLQGGARRMFDYLVEIYPSKVNKAELGLSTGMIPTSGTFGTYLSILRSNGLVDVERSEVKLSDNLFV